MVFRVLIVGWVLVLGSMSWGQEEPADAVVALKPRPMLERQQVTDAVEIDGQSVRFALHRYVGYPSVGITEEGTEDYPYNRQFPCFALAAVYPGQDREPTVLWNSGPTDLHLPNDEAAGGYIGRAWWDARNEQLLVAIAFANSPGESISVYQIDLEWQQDRDQLRVVDSFSVLRRNAVAGVEGQEKQDQSATSRVIESMEFTRTEDGGVALRVEHPDSAHALIEFRRVIERLDGKPSWLAPGKALEKAIRVDLARRGVGGE